MRLDDEQESSHYEVQDGRGGGGGGLGGGLGMLLPLIGSRFGCGGIAVVLVIMVVMGVNPLSLIGGGGGGGGQQVQTQQPSTAQLTDVQRTSLKVLGSTERRWTDIFKAQGQQYPPPTLVFYSQNGQSGCGAAQAAMGPFYCPSDQGIYLDTSFFDELAQRFGAQGDFAQNYVIAHEFGHHVQNLLGTSEQVQRQMAQSSRTEGNALSVRLELQADCYAGVWAAQNRDRLDPGDIQEGMTAAQAIGDDKLQQESQGRVVPDSFTHGTSAQRQAWLQRGLNSGDPRTCDTFNTAI